MANGQKELESCPPSSKWRDSAFYSDLNHGALARNSDKVNEGERDRQEREREGDRTIARGEERDGSGNNHLFSSYARSCRTMHYVNALNYSYYLLQGRLFGQHLR